MCVLKILHFKYKKGSPEICHNNFTEKYSIIQIKSKQKTQKYLEETTVPNHGFKYLGKQFLHYDELKM